MATMKILLEGDVHKLPTKNTPTEDYHYNKMREHSKLASHHASSSAAHSDIAANSGDLRLKALHGELASSHSAASLIHGAIKNHHYSEFKNARESGRVNRHKPPPDTLPDNVTRLRGNK